MCFIFFNYIYYNNFFSNLINLDMFTNDKVNRIMNEAIQTGIHLDRPIVAIILAFNQYSGPCDHIGLNYYKSENETDTINISSLLCRICITDERIRLMDYPPDVEDYLLEYEGVLLADDADCDDQALLEKVEEDEEYSNYQDFGIRSIEMGLEMILRMLFRRFYISKLCINSPNITIGSRESNWIAILRDEFSKSGSKCYDLDMADEYFGVTELYTTLSSNVILTIQSDDIEEFLPLQRFDRKMYITLEGNISAKMILSVVQLLQTWLSGNISIQLLMLSSDSPFPFSHDQLLFSLRNFPIVSVVNRNSDKQSEPMEIMINRSSDNKYLRIGNRDNSILSLEERKTAETRRDTTSDGIIQYARAKYPL